MENHNSPVSGSENLNGGKRKFKLWQMIAAFVAGAAIVGVVLIAPSFGTQGFIYNRGQSTCKSTLNTLDSQVNMLLNQFGLYSEAFSPKNMDVCVVEGKLNSILKVFNLYTESAEPEKTGRPNFQQTDTPPFKPLNPYTSSINKITKQIQPSSKCRQVCTADGHFCQMVCE